jgi:hypothetical protein
VAGCRALKITDFLGAHNMSKAVIIEKTADLKNSRSSMSPSDNLALVKYVFATRPWV